MQQYDAIAATDTLADSLVPLKNRDDTLKTNHSGTAFPAVVAADVGMTCFRTDENKLYELKSATGPVWALIADLGKTYLPKEDADALYLALGGGSMTGDATFANTKGVKGKDSGGTTRSLILVTNGNVAQIGDAAVAAQVLGTSQKLTPAGGTDDAVETGNGANLDTYIRSGKVAGKVVVGPTSATVQVGKAGATTEIMGDGKIDGASTFVGAVDAQGGLNASGGSLKKAGVNVMLTGKHGFFIPAQAMIPFDCGSLLAMGSGGGNPYAKGLQFDPNTQQNAHFCLAMPSSWDLAAIKYRFVWSAASGTVGNVCRWGVSALWLHDDDAFNTAYSTSALVNDALLAANDTHITGDITHTPDGTLNGTGMLALRFFRQAADAADTFDATAILLGVYMLPNFTGDADA